MARTWNDDLFDKHGIKKLTDDKVIKICKAIMSDIEKGKIVRMHGLRGTALTDADEVRRIMTMPNGDGALAFLMLLRAEHGARCKRGETFMLNVAAMVEARTMGSWAAPKYRNARDTLLAAGRIKQVTPASSCRAAKYVLTDRALSPSLPQFVGAKRSTM